MPIYEYKCDNCGDVFEKIEKFSDVPLTAHEKCGGPVHRLISLSAIKFKGSGFYINDYAPKSESSSNGADKPAETKTESKPEAKTESKPETKSEPAAKTETKTESKAPATTKHE
ncbi:MAG: FmdB family zinc ribbon protein [Bryobacteraceae bacterium]